MIGICICLFVLTMVFGWLTIDTIIGMVDEYKFRKEEKERKYREKIIADYLAKKSLEF